MNIYVDLDGVLADFDGFFKTLTGIPAPEYETEYGSDDFWGVINNTPDFFYNLPLLDGANDLMYFLEPFDPIILTAASKYRPSSHSEKIRWVEKHFGKDQRVITVMGGRSKQYWCRRGDILIDDWETNAPLWRAKGGIWITHKNVPQTIKELSEIL